MLDYNIDIREGSHGHIQTPDHYSRMFPFFVYESGYYIANDNYFTKRDFLNNYLIIYTVSGSGCLKWHDRQTVLTAGDAVVIDCRSFQEYATLEEAWCFYYTHFDGVLDGYKNSLLQNLTRIKLRSPESVSSRMAAICEASAKRDINSYATQSHMISGILTEMMDSLYAGQDNKGKRDRHDISELASFIHEHCKEDLHIEDFTMLVRLSPHHMIRLFKQQIGISPYKYMHKCRINLAQELLRGSELSIGEVAFEVGYSDPVMFIRHFSDFVGVTPGEYRNTNIVSSNVDILKSDLRGAENSKRKSESYEKIVRNH